MKTLAAIKLQNTDKKLDSKNICSNIIKTEMLSHKREAMILPNMFLDFKLKHIVKGAIAQIEQNKVNLLANQILQKTPT